jgi:hypothetical protein
MAPDPEIDPQDIFKSEQDIGPIEKPEEKTLGQREQTRKTIALILVWTFAGIVSASFLLGMIGLFCPGFDKTYVLEILKVLLPPVVALVGTVTGFYYGAQSK